MGFHHIPWVSIGFNFHNFHNFHNVPELSIMFHNLPQGSRMFHELPECSMSFQNIPECSIMFYNVLWYSMMFYDVPWHVLGLHVLERVLGRGLGPLVVGWGGTEVAGMLYLPNLEGTSPMLSNLSKGFHFSINSYICYHHVRQQQMVRGLRHSRDVEMRGCLRGEAWWRLGSWLSQWLTLYPR